MHDAASGIFTRMPDTEETVAQRILRRLEATGKNANGASIEAGGSPSLIPNILNGRSANPRIDTLMKIAPVLDTTADWLMWGDKGRPSSGSEARPAPSPQSNLSPIELPRDVPVRGTAAASPLGNGAFQITSDVIEYIRRPYGLIGAKDIYALYVENDSMYPRFAPGEPIYVHPHRKPLSGDDVVVHEPGSDNGDTRFFVKRLRRVTGTKLVTEQFNPPMTIEFIIRPGLIWHKVMTPAELYGM